MPPPAQTITLATTQMPIQPPLPPPNYYSPFTAFLVHLTQTTHPSLSLSTNQHQIFATVFPSPLSPVLGPLPAIYKKKLTDHHRFQVTTTPIPPCSHLTTLPLYLSQLSTSTTPMITMVHSPATHTYLNNPYVLNKDHNSELTCEPTHKLQTHPLRIHTQTPPVTTLHFPENSVTTPQVPWETSTRLHKQFPFLTPLSHHIV
jgi:hypothetical protein